MVKYMNKTKFIVGVEDESNLDELEEILKEFKILYSIKRIFSNPTKSIKHFYCESTMNIYDRFIRKAEELPFVVTVENI